MGSSLRAHAAIALLLTALLGGCGGNAAMRGELSYDLRPEDKRDLVVWPRESDTPRYRYIGELIGEPNFVDSGRRTASLPMRFLQWTAGLFESNSKQLLLERPQHGVVSDKGRVYVVDAGRNAVFVFDPLAPAKEQSDRGKGELLIWNFADPKTRFSGPIAVATVWGNDIAVSDAVLGFVARINELGIPVAKIGSGQLRRPTGLAFDPSRQLLFVADTVSNDIKVFDNAGNLVNSFGSAGEGPGEFNSPTHLAFAAGRLYVSDTLNSRIQVFNADGVHQQTFGKRGLVVGDLMRPKGIAASDAGLVYVVESYFGRLLTFSAQSQFLMDIDGSGLTDGSFLLPSGVWTDKHGRVFVADMFNRRVVVYQFLGADGG